MKYSYAVLAATLVLTACSHATQSGSQSGVASPGPVATNATGFPLYAGATIISAHEWTQRVDSATASAAKGTFSQGAGTYSGHQLIAGTPASIGQLRTWLDGLEKTPPAGYTPATLGGTDVSRARNRAQAVGIDFDVFQKTVSGRRHDVIVVALDPARLQEKAGPMLGFIARYKMLPESLRSPIDAQAKERTGFSISDALSPQSPLGAALGALDQLKSSNDRGVVVIDAQKL